MKLDKTEEQIERDKGLNAVYGATPSKAEPAPFAPPVSKQVSDSKRSTWKQRAWYVKPETASRLRAYVNRQQENGTNIDASEVVNQAIAEFLERVDS
jgi:hypothetical protein